jgi:hypothetical protein
VDGEALLVPGRDEDVADESGGRHGEGERGCCGKVVETLFATVEAKAK